MPGSAIMDPTVLVDDLFAELIDPLRDELHREFGVRAYDCFTVTRTWDGPGIGDGAFTEVETEIIPQPYVRFLLGSYRYDLEPCGIDEMGMIKLVEVSLTYTQAELDGGDALTANQEFLWRLKEGHGQLQRTTDWLVARPPYPDRAVTPQGPGWILYLRRA